MTMAVFVENRKVLYVDDEPALLDAFTSLMRKENIKITTLQNSENIDSVLNKEGPFAVVLSDQRMPVCDGVHVLEKVKQQNPDTIRILITGYSDQNDTIRAINLGEIHSYISKPWDDEDFKREVNDWIIRFNLQKHNKYLTKQLDDENRELNELLEGTIVQTVRVLRDVANHVSPQVAAFNERVKVIGTALLKSFPNLTANEKWEIFRALELFNLGIALLPTGVQNMIEKHGLSVLNRVSSAQNSHLLAAGLLKGIPRFKNVARIVELQARSYNGLGEPIDDFTQGENIPFGARFLHIIIDLVKTSSRSLSGTEALNLMLSHPKKYDIKLISQILGSSTVDNYKETEHTVNIKDVTPGMILVEDIRSKNNQLLMKAGFMLTETFIFILREWHKVNPIIEPIKVRTLL
jgi:response regulator RpfG family c-di-GMP phosphodiesterase